MRRIVSSFLFVLSAVVVVLAQSSRVRALVQQSLV